MYQHVPSFGVNTKKLFNIHIQNNNQQSLRPACGRLNFNRSHETVKEKRYWVQNFRVIPIMIQETERQTVRTELC
jgi:hypothetical protein